MKHHLILVGPICSGKNQVVKILNTDYGYQPIVFSDILKELALEHYASTAREALHKMANNLRKQSGANALAVETVKKAKQLQYTNVIYDGSRNPAEVEYIRSQFPGDTLVISLDAPQEIRFERMKHRNRPGDPKTLAEFKEIDHRELQGTEGEHGQRIADTMKLADITIMNDSSVDELKNKIKNSLEQHP